MHNDSPRQAYGFLRQAVPLMQKLDIAPTPYNYGIWYEYVRKTSPRLNQLVDNTLARIGHLPSFISRELFHEFLLAEEARYGSEHKDTLEQLINTVASSSEQMKSSIQQLEQVVTKSRHVLKRADRHQHLDKVVNYLEKGTHKALQDADKFQTSLQLVQKEIQGLKSELEELRNNVELDPLTGLLNQKGLERYLYQWLPGSEDDLSILLIDIDYLKAVNKQYGRRAGTGLICYMANLIRNRKIDNSALARLEGGTFALLINEATLDYASEYAEILREQMSRQRLRNKRGSNIENISVSIGVATVIGQETAVNFIARANRCLENAKRQGRNRIATR